jgi:DNA mismatch repair ATPase MutL
MSITSRSSNAQPAYQIQFVCGSRRSPAEVVQFHSSGTLVSLTHLFYHNKVKAGQVRQRADVSAVRRFLMSMALLHPQVRFSLRQASSQASSRPFCSLLQTSGSNNVKAVSEEILAGSGTTATSWRFLQYSGKGGIQISGMMSMVPHSTRDLQLVCVNRRYVLDTWLALQIEVGYHSVIRYVFGLCQEKVLVP